ncbi:MAG: primosomal protein N' [Opitutae bacterium]|nr:primosomal protein N' [Opitutae bacterium]
MQTANSLLVKVQPLGGFNKPLTYLVNKVTAKGIKIGSLVQIPLGNRKVSGIIWSFECEQPSNKHKIREIIKVIQETPAITPDLMTLANWISKYYACSKESCLEAMIPSAIRDGMKPKSQRLICLKKNNRDISNISKQANAQRKIIDFLEIHKDPLPASELIKKTFTSFSTVNNLLKKGILSETHEIVERVAYEDESPDSSMKVPSNIQLTTEQKKAASEIIDDLNLKTFKTRLLSGVTGSGKTEVYFEAMQHALKQGGTVLFLVPEVALAPQTVSRLRERFYSEKVVVWHSHLSAGERVDAWRNLTCGNARIVVGARSAIFAPLPNLRLIIVDEEHETSYKQEDNPRYQARDVAVVRAKANGSVCVLGSATPSLESINNVHKRKYEISKLSKRVDDRELPLVHLIDMRREKDKNRTTTIFSVPLVEALRERFANREQSILFLNRRGFNTTMLCPECGHVENCKDCSIALTYHRTDGYLKCHLCGFRKPSPLSCNQCKSFDLRKRGHGTQRIEDLVSDLLPKSAKIRRVDADVMTKRNLFRETLSDFRKGKIDVLVGTQMIAKGLDFPKVTLVGVIDADLPLRMEDFRASEKAFQMLVQVSGRSGRGNRAGEVFIQTYAPHSPSIQYARKADLDGFLEEELEMRKEFNYPPYRHLIRHLFRSRSQAKVDYYCSEWAKLVNKSQLEEITVKGPAPAPLEKIKGQYRYHLFYFTSSVNSALKALGKIREKFPLDPDVHDILDVDAYSIT